MAITLEAFGWRAVFLPALGGAMASLHFSNQPVLRSGGPDLDDILDCASFPLIPFANRIGHGLLRINDAVLALEPEPAAFPHALHGHGWRRPWQVADRSASHLTLFYDHPGRGAQGGEGAGGWPWPYRATQRFVIHASGLRIGMTVRNRDPRAAMPCGTGIHPYFARRRNSAITMNATAMWDNHPDGLARAMVPTDLFASARRVPVDALEGLDNFFPCSGPVGIWGGGHPVLVQGSAMAGVHLYVPAGADYFCVEPVSHAPDAFGRGDYGRADMLAPGAQAQWQWTIRSG